MKTLFLIFSLTFSLNVLYGQVSNYTDIFVHKPFFEELSNPAETPEIEVEGNPFMDSIFTNGEFLIKNTKYILPMRYNIFLDAFEVKFETNTLFINSNVVDTVYYRDSQYIFKKVGTKQKTFQVLSQTDSTLFLKKHGVVFIQGSFGVPFKQDVYPHYETKIPEYYYFKEGTDMVKINGLNDFTLIKPELKDEIKTYIKKSKFKKNNEKDLIKLYKYVVELKPKKD